LLHPKFRSALPQNISYQRRSCMFPIRFTTPPRPRNVHQIGQIGPQAGSCNLPSPIFSWVVFWALIMEIQPRTPCQYARQGWSCIGILKGGWWGGKAGSRGREWLFLLLVERLHGDSMRLRNDLSGSLLYLCQRSFLGERRERALRVSERCIKTPVLPCIPLRQRFFLLFISISTSQKSSDSLFSESRIHTIHAKWREEIMSSHCPASCWRLESCSSSPPSQSWVSQPTASPSCHSTAST
jgi:hypothetical protein